MLNERLKNHPNYQEFLKAQREQRSLHVYLDFWKPYLNLLETLEIPSLDKLKVELNDQVSVRGSFASPSNGELFGKLLEMLIPWRKGPFHLMGYDIDSEWRSELKWSRIEPYLKGLEGKSIADVGCNNGYYLFRLLEHNPEFVLGLDPNGRFYYQFDLINRFIRAKNVAYEVLGVEHLPLLSGLFDLVLCMGVIYHRRDPVKMLIDIKESLRPGGKVILESITIPGPKDFCLFPKDRYAMMRNVWFIPTESTLLSWIARTGFINIEVIDTSVTTILEQRKTHYAPFDSLVDFLDPKDHAKTVEGYPAPLRTIVIAELP